MNTSNINQNEFESIFNFPTNAVAEKASGFEFEEAPLFGKKEEKSAEEEAPANEKVVEKTEESEKKDEKDKEDSLFDDGKTNTSDFDINTIKKYFDAKIQEGKFLALEDGKMESIDDIDALIEANFTHKIEEIRESVIQSAYEEKSPAWKFILQHSEKYSNPAELIPIIEGVKNIDTVSSLDPTNEQEAEHIIRMALSRRKEDPELIEEQISTFKQNGKLSTIAEKYQPILIQEENQRLAAIKQRKELEELQNIETIKAIHTNVVDILEKPFLGKFNLKNEEKAAIYDLIAEPQEQNGGYKIFSAIDNLYEKNDYETLQEIALLLQNKESHRKYFGISVSGKTAENLIRKVKTTQTASTTSQPELPKNTIPKNPTNGSGFGFFLK